MYRSELDAAALAVVDEALGFVGGDPLGGEVVAVKVPALVGDMNVIGGPGGTENGRGDHFDASFFEVRGAFPSR